MIRLRTIQCGLAVLLAGCGSSEAPPSAKSATVLDPHKTSGFFSAANDAAGRILAAGYFIDDERTQGQLLIARFNRDGSLDAGFGSEGLTYLSVPDEKFATTRDVIVDSRQQSVVCGYGYTLDEDEQATTSATAILVRLDAEGRPDPTFGSKGLARLPPELGLETVCGGLRQANGYYYMLGAAGHAFLINSERLPLDIGTVRPVDGYSFVVRFDESGVFDSSFANDGVHELPGQNETSPEILRQDAQGRLYAVYTTWQSGGYEIWVDRMLRDGSLDATYGDSGRMRMHVDAAAEESWVADGGIDAVGRLNLAGGIYTYNDERTDGYATAMIWRATESGQPDAEQHRRVRQANRSLGSAAFFLFAPGPQGAHALRIDDSGYDVVGLSIDGLVDPRYRPMKPEIIPYSLLDLGDQLLAAGQVITQIDGEPNAAAAIEFLPR